MLIQRQGIVLALRRIVRTSLDPVEKSKRAHSVYHIGHQPHIPLVLLGFCHDHMEKAKHQKQEQEIACLGPRARHPLHVLVLIQVIVVSVHLPAVPLYWSGSSSGREGRCGLQRGKRIELKRLLRSGLLERVKIDPTVIALVHSVGPTYLLLIYKNIFVREILFFLQPRTG